MRKVIVLSNASLFQNAVGGVARHDAGRNGKSGIVVTAFALA